MAVISMVGGRGFGGVLGRGRPENWRRLGIVVRVVASSGSVFCAGVIDLGGTRAGAAGILGRVVGIPIVLVS